MGGYADPAALDRHARQLSADADAVRAQSRSLQASVASMRWRGEAADAFRRTVERDATGLRRAADALDDAAAAMSAQAAQVRAALEKIQATQRAAEALLEQTRRRLVGAVLG